MEKKVEKKKSSSIGKIIVGFVVIVLIAAASFGIYWFIDSSTYLTVDDAKVTGDILNVSPKTAGKVSEVKVAEGAKVKKGDVLFTLETDQAKIQLDQAKAALDGAKAQLAKAVGGARAEEIVGAQALVDQAEAGVNGAKIGKQNLQSTLKDTQSKYNDLLSQMASFKNPSTGKYDEAYAFNQLNAAKTKGILNDTQYSTKVEAIEQLFSAKQQLEAQISQLKGQIKASDSQISASNANLKAAESKLSLTNKGASSQDIAALTAQVKAAQASYDLAKLNLDNTQVKSPIDGTVAQVNVLVGDNAAPGQGVISIVDLSKLQITANIDENDVTRVKEGQNVKLVIAAFKGMTFNGKISEVGLATSSALNSGISLDLGSSSSSNEEIPVKINFDYQGQNIRPGMSVTAKINVKK